MSVKRFEDLAQGVTLAHGNDVERRAAENDVPALALKVQLHGETVEFGVQELFDLLGIHVGSFLV
jgi:hypothetical protein